MTNNHFNTSTLLINFAANSQQSKHKKTHKLVLILDLNEIIFSFEFTDVHSYGTLIFTHEMIDLSGSLNKTAKM